MILSMIYLPGIKVDWFTLMQYFSKGFNLLTKIVDMILYTTLHRLIGLKWDTNTGCSILEIRVIIISFIALNRFPE